MKLPLVTLATEPVSAGELYRFLSGKEFINELAGEPADYDFRTVHARCFGAAGPYLMSREEIMNEIREFVNT